MAAVAPAVAAVGRDAVGVGAAGVGPAQADEAPVG
jgi:hypothetical protein